MKAAGNSSVLQEVPTNDLFNPEEKGSKALNWSLFNLSVLRCPEDFLTATHEELPTNQNSYYAQRTPQEDGGPSKNMGNKTKHKNRERGPNS